MKHNGTNLLALICIAVLGLCGCKQDIAGTGWDVDILAPVIHTELTMANLVADSLLASDADGLLRLKVETPLIDFPLDSILKIPDTTVSNSVSLPVNLNDIPPGTVLSPLTSETTYDLGELALKKVVLREGTLKLKVKSILETDVSFIYQLPGASRGGAIFETTQSVSAGSISDTASANFEFDLSGYAVDLRGTDGSGFNTLATSYILSTSINGDTISIPSFQEFFVLEYSFLNIVPDYGLGYFGQQSSSVEDENSKIDVLSRITDGQMFLDSVSIGLTVTNGVGADAQFKLDRLQSINTRTGSTIDLNHNIIGSTLLLTRAQDIDGTPEGVNASLLFYHLNNGNSNIKQFVENLPDELGFTFDFELNPLGNVSAGNDFFYYDRPFQAIMDINVPLRARLTDLTLVDTLLWDLSQGGTVEAINSGSFTLIAQNGFPLEGLVELILLDENSIDIDTLIAPSMVLSPPIDSENKVIEPIESRITIPIPEQTSGILANTRAVRIKVKFNTSAQPDLIEFYESYGLDLKLVGNLNINFGSSVF